MSTEIYKRYRPKTLQGVVGQDSAVKSFHKLITSSKVPHAILLAGPSGVGKTTIARILKGHLRCADNDFFELNCADFRGVDDVRNIRQHLGFRPLGGRCRIWLIDECHKLTNDAQNALLKMLEDTPDHVYFMLATTDPQKLIKTIHTRCTMLKLNPISSQHLMDLVQEIADKEGFNLSTEVIEQIVDAAEGSARKALVILEQVGMEEKEEDQLKAITSVAFNKDVTYELAKTLMFERPAWTDVAKLLRQLNDQDPEGIRYCILGLARAMLIGKDEKPPNPKFTGRAYVLIDIFSKNFYDGKQAALAAACWEALHTKE